MTVRSHRRRRWIATLLAAAALTAGHVTGAEERLPALEQIVREARAHAPGLASARGALGVARAAGIGAKASSVLNPSLELRIEHGRPPGASTLGGVLTLPVEIAGQRGARIDEANALARWREAELAGAEARVVGDAVATYGAVLALGARLREIETAAEDARLEADWFTRRLAAGDATLSDQSLADAELGRWTQQRAEAGMALTEAATHLAELTGRTEPLVPGEVTEASLPGHRPAWDSASVAAVVARNPEVRARALEASHWTAARARLEAERSPPLSLLVTAGRGDLGEARIGGGLGWTLPVLRRSEGEIARADAEASRASNERASIERVVAARLNGIHAVYRGAIEALAELDAKGLPATRRHVEAAVASLRAGKIELVQVLIAKRDLALAVTRRLDLVATAWRAYGELVALKGDLL